MRNQFRDHHPRHDFWRDHPLAATRRWTQPYRWATWGAVAGFFPWRWNESSTYAYGENIYYEGDEVYYGDKAVASTDEYAEQAQTLVASAPEVDEAIEWMSLGVFAVTQDGEESGSPPTFFLQLAINKQGIIAGTFQDTATDKSQPIEGAWSSEDAVADAADLKHHVVGADRGHHAVKRGDHALAAAAVVALLAVHTATANASAASSGRGSSSSARTAWTMRCTWSLAARP